MKAGKNIQKWRMLVVLWVIALALVALAFSLVWPLFQRQMVLSNRAYDASLTLGQIRSIEQVMQAFEPVYYYHNLGMVQEALNGQALYVGNIEFKKIFPQTLYFYSPQSVLAPEESFKQSHGVLNALPSYEGTTDNVLSQRAFVQDNLDRLTALLLKYDLKVAYVQVHYASLEVRTEDGKVFVLSLENFNSKVKRLGILLNFLYNTQKLHTALQFDIRYQNSVAVRYLNE